MKWKIAPVFVFVLLISLVPTALAQSPLECSGVPVPTTAQAQIRLDAEPELYVVASAAGLPALRVAGAKIQYDYCFGLSNALTNQFQWHATYWSRANDFSKLVGVSRPFMDYAGSRLTPEYENRVGVFAHIWNLPE